MSKEYTILNPGAELDTLIARHGELNVPVVMWSPATGAPHVYTEELRAWRSAADGEVAK